jgi:hypothetical protein
MKHFVFTPAAVHLLLVLRVPLVLLYAHARDVPIPGDNFMKLHFAAKHLFLNMAFRAFKIPKTFVIT